MANNEKGLNRGGVGGQEGELGEESKDLEVEKNLEVERPKPGAFDEPGQQRGGMQGGTGRNSDLVREQQRGGLRREPDLEGAEKKTDHEVD